MSIPITNLTTPLAAFAALWPQGGYKIVFAKGSPILVAWSVKDAQGNAIASPLDAEGNPSAALLAADATASLAAAKTAQCGLLGAALRAALTALYTSWTPDCQYFFYGASQKMLIDIAAGQIAAAITAVNNYQSVPTDYLTQQTAVLGVLNTYAPLFAEVAAATTVAAVQAVAVPS